MRNKKRPFITLNDGSRLDVLAAIEVLTSDCLQHRTLNKPDFDSLLQQQIKALLGCNGISSGVAMTLCGVAANLRINSPVFQAEFAARAAARKGGGH